LQISNKIFNSIIIVIILTSLISYCNQFNEPEVNKISICIPKPQEYKDSLKLHQTTEYINKINPRLSDDLVESISNHIVKTSNIFPGVDYSMMLAIFHTESTFKPNQLGETNDVGLGQLTNWVTLEYNIIRGLDPDKFVHKDRHNLADNIWLSFWYLDFIKGKYANGNKYQTIVYYNGGNRQRRKFVKGHKMVKTTSNYLKKIKRRMKLVRKSIEGIS